MAPALSTWRLVFADAFREHVVSHLIQAVANSGVSRFDVKGTTLGHRRSQHRTCRALVLVALAWFAAAGCCTRNKRAPRIDPDESGRHESLWGALVAERTSDISTDEIEDEPARRTETTLTVKPRMRIYLDDRSTAAEVRKVLKMRVPVNHHQSCLRPCTVTIEARITRPEDAAVRLTAEAGAGPRIDAVYGASTPRQKDETVALTFDGPIAPSKAEARAGARDDAAKARDDAAYGATPRQDDKTVTLTFKAPIAPTQEDYPFKLTIGVNREKAGREKVEIDVESIVIAAD